MLDHDALTQIADWLVGAPLKIVLIAIDALSSVLRSIVTFVIYLTAALMVLGQHWSRALLDVEVAYDTDIEHAQRVIKRVADAVWEENGSILDEPQMWGVEQLGAHGIALRLVVKTTPSEQWKVSRVLRERIKTAFDEEGIEIPFPQQMVWHRTAAAA